MYTVRKISLQLLTFAIISTCLMNYSDLRADTFIVSGDVDRFITRNSETETYTDVYDGTFKAIVTYDSNTPSFFDLDKWAQCFSYAGSVEDDYCNEISRAGWKDSIELIHYEVFDTDGNLIWARSIQRETEIEGPIIEFNRIINSETIYTLGQEDFTDNSESSWYIVKGSADDYSYEESAIFSWYNAGTVSFMPSYLEIPNVAILNTATRPTFSASIGYDDGINIDQKELSATITSLLLLNDTDGDGINDDEDACVNSDLSATVIFNGNDSGVNNALLIDGCTISDSINALFTQALNHGEFVSEVSKLLKRLEDKGIISKTNKGSIQSAVASYK